MPACPSCGAENPSESQFCQGCGEKLPLILPISDAASHPPSTDGTSPEPSVTLAEADTQPFAPVETPPPPPVRSSHRTTWLIGGCAALFGVLVVSAICLVAAFALYARENPAVLASFSRSGAAVPSPTPARAVPIATPTSAATPRSTPTSRTATPTAVPIPTIKIGTENLPVKQMVLSEDFKNSSRGWQEEKVEGLYKDVSNGEYHIEIRNPNLAENSVIKAAQPPIASDFAVLVSARTDLGPKKNQYGLLYGDKAANQYYQLTVSDNGNFMVSYFGPRDRGMPGWQTVVAWQPTRAVRPQGTFNALAIVRRGATLTFYLNGQKIHSLENNAVFPVSQVGVYAGTFDEPIAIAFDDLYLATLR